MRVFSHKWFPGREITVTSMGEALFLETDFWEKQRITIASGVAQGIALAFK